MRRYLAIALAALLALATVSSAYADDPHRGNSGNFSTASCPVAGNPNCPPQGK